MTTTTYRIDDEHGTEIATGFQFREAAQAAALRWENEHPGRQAFVSEDVPETTYAIKHSHGQTDTGYETYEAACAAVRRVYSDAEIGHDGDISQGGERTLCWASAEAAANDDGSRACCVIQARHPA